MAAQNVFDKPNGAFTGEISVEQLKDSNITWTLLGHSERRVILRESDDFVASKTKHALDGGIGVILCCGESLEEREADRTVEVVTKQLKAVADKISKDQWAKVVVAYEPIWYVTMFSILRSSLFSILRFVNDTYIHIGQLGPEKSRRQNKHKKFTRPFGPGWARPSPPTLLRTHESSTVEVYPRRIAKNLRNSPMSTAF